MEIIQYTCPNCGGNLEPIGDGMGKCPYCKSISSMPTFNSEKYNRAERLRREMLNFDDALEMYEEIAKESADADVYWKIVLCRYGIEYVDEGNGEYKATCHRTIEIPIREDSDFKIACEKATDKQRKYYFDEAAYIDAVQKKILEISHKEESSYDIFISYKAKDDITGDITPDSKEAQKIYYRLRERGYRVFFAEESLRNVIGAEYEPHIYAALKSSKVMILVGSRPDYFNATWVKNEWRRFLDMKNHSDNKILIPVFFDMDAYDMPRQIASLQSVNWRDAEAMETLVEGIEGVFGSSGKEYTTDVALSEALLRKAQSDAGLHYQNAKELLEKGGFDAALGEINSAIEIKPDYAEAYWLRMMIKNRTSPGNLLRLKADLARDADSIQAIHLSTGELNAEYRRISDLCTKNYIVQADYDWKQKAINDKYYKMVSQNESAELKKRATDLYNATFPWMDLAWKPRKTVIAGFFIILKVVVAVIACRLIIGEYFWKADTGFGIILSIVAFLFPFAWTWVFYNSLITGKAGRIMSIIVSFIGNAGALFFDVKRIIRWEELENGDEMLLSTIVYPASVALFIIADVLIVAIVSMREANKIKKYENALRDYGREIEKIKKEYLLEVDSVFRQYKDMNLDEVVVITENTSLVSDGIIDKLSESLVEEMKERVNESAKIIKT